MQRGQDFDKKSLYLKEYTAKRLTDEFPEKSWTKHGVNCSKVVGHRTVDRRPGRPCSARTEENAKLLLQKFPQSATDFVLAGEATKNTFSPV